MYLSSVGFLFPYFCNDFTLHYVFIFCWISFPSFSLLQNVIHRLYWYLLILACGGLVHRRWYCEYVFFCHILTIWSFIEKRYWCLELQRKDTGFSAILMTVIWIVTGKSCNSLWPYGNLGRIYCEVSWLTCPLLCYGYAFNSSSLLPLYTKCRWYDSTIRSPRTSCAQLFTISFTCE